MSVNELTKDEYIIRIITKPHLGYEHKVGNFSFKCAIGAMIICPACNILGKSTPYWLIGCIDRELNDYIVYKTSYLIFRQIQLFARDNYWGDTIEYDLHIKMDFIYSYNRTYKRNRVKYTVLGKQPKPLSSSDLLLKEKIDIDFLKNQTDPPTKEYFDNFEYRFKNKLSLLL